MMDHHIRKTSMTGTRIEDEFTIAYLTYFSTHNTG